MKSIDSYLCREAEKVHAFTFCGVDYFVGDKLTALQAKELARLAKIIASDDFRKALKIDRFACNRYVDCAL